MGDAAPQVGPADIDIPQLCDAVRRLGFEERSALAAALQPLLALVSPDALDHLRIRERDAAVMELAACREGSRNALAITLHQEIRRYAASTWLREMDREVAASVNNAAAHLFLKRTFGRVLSARQLTRILEGLPSSVGAMANGAAQKPKSRRPT